MSESINLKPVKELNTNYSFIIPDYQRGYRWDKEQVEKLLDDLLEFDIKIHKSKSQEIYCMQPLVVKEVEVIVDGKKETKWRVVDGQQRLTTLYIVLKLLGLSTSLFSIEYESRPDSNSFLRNIETKKGKNKKDDNADYYYMWEARRTILAWKNKRNGYTVEGYRYKLSDFRKTILERVNFIWYTITSEETEVFQRLNIGRISLTESELVKALFLNENNFPNEEYKHKRDEIANEWDMIEYRLQDDRFWLFFHGVEYNSPTRIDFILDIVRYIQENKDVENNKRFQTFEFFYSNYKDTNNFVDEYWKVILKVFNALEEWYNDEELYHYIGFLAAVKYDRENKNRFVFDAIKSYLEDPKKITKKSYKENLMKKIKKVLFPASIKNYCKSNGISYLDFNYEEKIGRTVYEKKTTRPLLLFHNVQTILDQNNCLTAEKKYGLPEFYRFPFYLYKKDSWDIEHIRPDHKQTFEGPRKKNLRKKYVYTLEKALNQQEHNQKATIEDYIAEYESAYSTAYVKKNGADDAKSKEEEIFHKLYKIANDGQDKELDKTRRNKIWNYTLLDSSTNREYGNYWFSVKRDYVIKKENGIKPMLLVDDNGNVTTNDVLETAFVPICTRRVFSKGYTKLPANLDYWTELDAAYYRMDIEKRLWWYFKEDIADAMTVDKGKISQEAYLKLYESYEKFVLADENNYQITMCDYCRTYRSKLAGKL